LESTGLHSGMQTVAQEESITAFNADSFQRGICFANFAPRCKPLRRQAGSVLPVNLALWRYT